MELSPAVFEPGRAVVARVAAFLPNLAGAVLVLLAGWLVARGVRVIVFRGLLAVRFDVASEKAGIDAILIRADLRQNPAEVVALLAQWLVLLVALVAAVNTLGLSSLSDLLGQMLLYLPKVVAAVVVLVLGLFLATFLAGVVRTAAAGAGMGDADMLGALARYAIVAFTVAVTLEELGIAAELVRAAFVILFGAVALALALAFGLGCKDLAREWVVRYLDAIRRRKPR